MPRSLHAQMMRSAISPRLATRIFLNGTDAKERFSVFHRLPVLNELAFDHAGGIGLDFVHQLHRFDDAENIAGCHLFAYTHEWRRAWRRAIVIGADNRRL